MINIDALYRKKLLKIPRPTFVVFYDGKEDFPEYREMKLSDAFLGENDEEIALQLIVKLYNINYSIVLTSCKMLSSESVQYMIENATDKTITITLHHEAYERAIADAGVQTALANKTNVSLAKAE